MGLLGSTHCVAMCGGVVAVSCSAVPLKRRATPAAQLPYTLAYNAGRIASYACAGAAAGFFGSAVASLGLVAQAQLGLRLLAGVMMILVGVYVAGLGPALAWLERAGAPLWRLIAPWARRLVPLRSPWTALALGMLWGWMPCGLVYAALAAAVTSGSPLSGAATMAAFGLGTLPMLLAMGSAAAAVARAAKIRGVRMAAGLAIVGFGLLHLVHSAQAWASAGTPDAHLCCSHHH
jgi:sulfite exporter TauE/SafE